MAYSLFRVGGIYHYRFQLGKERTQRTTRETSRTKADAIAQKAWDEARLRFLGDEPTPTLEDLAKAWLEAHELTRSESHLKTVRTFLRSHLYSLQGLRLYEINTEAVERARVEHLKGRSPSTANLWLRILKVLFKWAITRRMLHAGGMPWQVKQLKVQKKPLPVLSAAQVKPWLSAVDKATRRTDPRIGLACRLMLFLGLREMEALRARWEWVDWHRDTYTPGVTKGREAKALPMVLIREHLEPIRKKRGWILAGGDGNPPSQGFAREAQQIANEACGTFGITNHRLRGSLATLLSEAGLAEQDIQDILRHKDRRTTAGYTEVNRDRQIAAMNRLRASVKNSKSNPYK